MEIRENMKGKTRICPFHFCVRYIRFKTFFAFLFFKVINYDDYTRAKSPRRF